jgi:hypothetical protein
LRQDAAKAAAEAAIDATRWAQIVELVKENQLLTALGLFLLYQTGVLLSAASYVQGGVC